MESGYKGYIGRRQFAAFVAAIVCAFVFPTISWGVQPKAYDIERARAICDSITPEGPEGIWIYPDDNVTVLVLESLPISSTSLPSYSISVVESTDCNLEPGDNLGTLYATPDSGKYRLELFTQRKNGFLSKPQTCLAPLSDEGETMIIKKEKSGFKFRFSINPSTLLPKMWRILRIGTSHSSSKPELPVGMVKIYPSYDGNGSSRRSPRYL